MVRQAGVERLIALMSAILGWMVLNSLELIAVTPEETAAWAKFTYLFIAATPALWLMFVLDLLEYHKWLRKPFSWLYWVAPVLTIVGVFTNDVHHWFWKTQTFLMAGNYLVIQVTHGPWYYLCWVIIQAMVLAGCVLLLNGAYRQTDLYRWQASWLTGGALLVIVFNLIYITRVFPGLQKDYTPIALALSTLCFAIAISRFQLLKDIPMGAATLFETLDYGVIVVNVDFTIISINPAAQHLLEITEKEAAGNPLSSILSQLPTLPLSAIDHGNPRFDLKVRESPPFYLNIAMNPIRDSSNHLLGRLILLHDVTNDRLSQLTEHNERVFAEALSRLAAALNSTRNLDQLLDLILASVFQVTACDSANIMLIEGNYSRVMRSQDPKQINMQLNIDTTPTLRRMIETHAPLVIPDTELEPEWVKLPKTLWSRSYVGAPIVTVDGVVGFINLDSYEPRVYTQAIAERLQAFADHASIAIQNARVYNRLEELATVDALTHLCNRRHFFEQAAKEFARALRYQRPLSLMIIDLDFFKRVNDSYGHLVGDQVLAHVAQVCKSVMRTADITSRYGGEEFAILLPETDLKEARQVCERLCAQIAASGAQTSAGTIHITASLGVAELDATCLRLEDLLDHADQTMYRAKSNGRNRVETYQPVPELAKNHELNPSSGSSQTE